MKRPDPPVYAEEYRDPRNRFSWFPRQNPSPERSTRATHREESNESLPVLCQWCGYPYWPPWYIIEGCCSEACEQADAAWKQERAARLKLLAELQEEEDLPVDEIRGIMGRGSVV